MPVTIRFANNRAGHALKNLKSQINRFHEQYPDIQVELVNLPHNAGDFLPLYLDYFSSASDQIDLFSMDIVATGAIAEHAVDLRKHFSDDDLKQFFPVNISSATVNSQLVALPWYIDSDVLFYRTDLLEAYELEVPQTWDALEQAARAIQQGEREKDNMDFYGYLWTGQVDESLTCNGLLWQASSGGGHIVNPEGQVTVNNPETIEALERAARWIGTISPPSTSRLDLLDVVTLWNNNQAAFMHNWFYVHRLIQNSAGRNKFNIVPLPGKIPELQTAVLGGWQLVVSRYSNNIEAAITLLRFLTSPAEQKFRAMQRDDNPGIQHLYEDEELLALYPYYRHLDGVFKRAISRPVAIAGKQYAGVSSLYRETIHKVLIGELPAPYALEQLEEYITKILK